VILRKICGIGDYHAKENKPDSEGHVLHVYSHMWKYRRKKREDMKLKDYCG
jgi:hypothetical protein